MTGLEHQGFVGLGSALKVPVTVGQPAELVSKLRTCIFFRITKGASTALRTRHTTPPQKALSTYIVVKVGLPLSEFVMTVP